VYNIGQTTVVGSIEEARDQNFQVISEYRAQCGDEDTRTLEGQIVIDPVHAGDKMPGTEKGLNS
jgi:hypothetical protein